MFKSRVTSMPKLGSPGFRQAQMRSIGNASLRAEKARIADGRNLQDAPAKALLKSYAVQKAKQGQPAIRNMYLTGALLESQRVTSASNGSVEIGFANDHEERIAEVNNAIDPMIGISPANERATDSAVRKLFEANLSKISQ